MRYSVSLTKEQLGRIKKHLFPGDGKEAVAFLLCGTTEGTDRKKFLVHEIHEISHAVCVRSENSITWPTEPLVSILERANKRGLALVKIHSHPTGYPKFSATDDRADRDLFAHVFEWIDFPSVHGSLVMLPDGRIFGRAVKDDGVQAFESISLIGEELVIWWDGESERALEEFALRHIQAFGEGTFRTLKRLKIGVVGCSGTGSPLIEQIVRLGVGELVLIDPDLIEEKNLNRIVNSFWKCVQAKEPKVIVLKRAIEEMGIGTKVLALQKNIFCREAVEALADCDFIFGCVDSIDGRHLLNKLSTFYLIPYIDVGVRLIADGEGSVSEICGSTHFLQPGLSTLLSRGLYSQEKLRAATLIRENPGEYRSLLAEGYISGVNEERPAVISVNFQFASQAVNDFLARIHAFREGGNAMYAKDTFSLFSGERYRESEAQFLSYAPWQKYIGRGHMKPLLDMPELSNND